MVEDSAYKKRATPAGGPAWVNGKMLIRQLDRRVADGTNYRCWPLFRVQKKGRFEAALWVVESLLLFTEGWC